MVNALQCTEVVVVFVQTQLSDHSRTQLVCFVDCKVRCTCPIQTLVVALTRENDAFCTVVLVYLVVGTLRVGVTSESVTMLPISALGMLYSVWQRRSSRCCLCFSTVPV